MAAVRPPARADCATVDEALNAAPNSMIPNVSSTSTGSTIANSTMTDPRSSAALHARLRSVDRFTHLAGIRVPLYLFGLFSRKGNLSELGRIATQSGKKSLTATNTTNAATSALNYIKVTPGREGRQCAKLRA